MSDRVRHQPPTGAALAAASALLVSACTTTVFPPPRVADAARVGVLDHGRHASLILEISDDGMVRYAYGDWDWYALRQTGAIEGTSALLWPSQAALGRMRLPGPFSPPPVSRQVKVPYEAAIYLTANAHDVGRLVDRLDRIFHENRETRLYNQALHLVFVRHPKPYWVFHNSNQVIGDWLEQLGCRVDGPAIFSVWQRGTVLGAPSGTRSTDAALSDPRGSAETEQPAVHTCQEMPGSSAVRVNSRSGMCKNCVSATAQATGIAQSASSFHSDLATLGPRDLGPSLSACFMSDLVPAVVQTSGRHGLSLGRAPP